MSILDQPFTHILLLLGVAVAVVVAFQRLRIPSSLGYLLVGVLLGPHTAGPIVDEREIRVLAEFGIVFLLFTVGLNFSLPQIHALRHQVLGLGTAQVATTTLAVGLLAWAIGLPPAAAFVIGAVFAQSSTTIIVKQLTDQGEEQSRHGRLGTAMSVFQDVTAVPFLVVIPVLGGIASQSIAGSLGWALTKAVLAFALVVLVGRWLLRPLFHVVAARRSAELFTLTVLFVSLAAAWTTNALGLSMAFGAFLAGMILGDTEFRHQVESTIRPFRDVLLGLFFVSVGMLFDPFSLPQVWEWALVGAAVLLVSKTLLVSQTVRWVIDDSLTAWRTGLLLAVGGEFGFALLALALQANAIAEHYAQIALTAVLMSMIAGPFLIRYNYAIARYFAGRVAHEKKQEGLRIGADVGESLRDHVIICGYGRIGQSVARFLDEEKIPYLAIDLDAERVRMARAAGEPVYYGDAAERDVLESVGANSARLMVISHDDPAAAHKALQHMRALRPDLPIMARTRDENHAEALRQAGATEVVPETLEAGMMIASQVLMLLNVPLPRVMQRIQEQRANRYRLLRELFPGGDNGLSGEPAMRDDELRPIRLPAQGPAIGHRLGEFAFDGLVVTALVRGGQRQLAPPPETRLEPEDVVVLFGRPEDLDRAERLLLID